MRTFTPLLGVLFVSLFANSLALAAPGTSAARVHLAGDSTMATKERKLPTPEYGWGEVFGRYFKTPETVVNYALNGRSTKSFRDEGAWDKLLAALHAGDFVIIQFGHNDEKSEDPKRYAAPRGAYQENLRRFIAEVRAAGATPLLATPVARRKWDEAGEKMVETHGDYPDAVRAVAKEENVPLLEMNRLTTELEFSHGVEGSKALHLHIAAGVYERQPKGWADNTHYSEYGADRVAALAVQEILRLQLQLKDLLK